MRQFSISCRCGATRTVRASQSGSETLCDKCGFTCSIPSLLELQNRPLVESSDGIFASELPGEPPRKPQLTIAWLLCATTAFATLYAFASLVISGFQQQNPADTPQKIYLAPLAVPASPDLQRDKQLMWETLGTTDRQKTPESPVYAVRAAQRIIKTLHSDLIGRTLSECASLLEMEEGRNFVDEAPGGDQPHSGFIIPFESDGFVVEYRFTLDAESKVTSVDETIALRFSLRGN